MKRNVFKYVDVGVFDQTKGCYFEPDAFVSP
jgi:hypothetical protein